MELTAEKMMEALSSLDRKLKKPLRLIVGGGGAMLLAHHFKLSTTDIDAVPTGGMSIEELDPLIKTVAKELGLAPDWLNPFYSSFAHVLPSDYGNRLISIGKFEKLLVSALSTTDLLIMKCFAARQKDVVHARVLYKKGADLKTVRNQIQYLKGRHIPGCEKAERFLSEVESFFADKDEE